MDTYWDFLYQNVIISISNPTYFFHKTTIPVPKKLPRYRIDEKKQNKLIRNDSGPSVSSLLDLILLRHVPLTQHISCKDFVH